MAATHSHSGSRAKRFLAALLVLFALQPLLHAHAAGAPISADPVGFHLPALADGLALSAGQLPAQPEIIEVEDGVRAKLVLAGPFTAALLLPDVESISARPSYIEGIAPPAGASPLAPSPRDPPLL